MSNSDHKQILKNLERELLSRRLFHESAERHYQRLTDTYSRGVRSDASISSYLDIVKHSKCEQIPTGGDFWKAVYCPSRRFGILSYDTDRLRHVVIFGSKNKFISDFRTIQEHGKPPVYIGPSYRKAPNF